MIKKDKTIHNDLDEDALLTEYLAYAEKFDRIYEEGNRLEKEYMEINEKIKAYGGEDKVPEENKILIEDAKIKLTEFARNTLKFIKLMDEYDDFCDCVKKEEPDVDRLS